MASRVVMSPGTALFIPLCTSTVTSQGALVDTSIASDVTHNIFPKVLCSSSIINELNKKDLYTEIISGIEKQYLHLFATRAAPLLLACSRPSTKSNLGIDWQTT